MEQVHFPVKIGHLETAIDGRGEGTARGSRDSPQNPGREARPDVSAQQSAFVLIEKGDAAAAEPFLREGLAIVTGLQGERFQIAPSVENNWARFLQSTGEWSEAERAFQKALDDAVATSGPVSLQVARITSNLGMLQFDQGHYARAEGFARQAVAMCRTLGGNGMPALSSEWINLAEDRVFQDDPAGAIPLLRDAVQSAHAAPYPLLPCQIAEAESALGDCLLQLHRAGEAGPLLQDSQAALRTHPRPAFRHPRVRRAR